MIDNADEFESVALIRFPEKIAAEITQKLKAEGQAYNVKDQDVRGVGDIFEKRLNIKFNQDKVIQKLNIAVVFSFCYLSRIFKTILCAKN